MSENATPSSNFIRPIIAADIEKGLDPGRVLTRFPPEPNGYLHIGHAKSICLNFGLAAEFGGKCNLRLDDTNPTKEEVEYVESIKNDVRWLGFSWNGVERYASDYFEQLYGFAVKLIEMGKAYVDSSTAEEIRGMRGSLTEPGQESPFRQRGVAENLDLFKRMRAGEFSDGAHVLRAKIDMSSPNVVLRDPTLYRIRHAHHHRTGNNWCIYPMYDFAHCLSDAIEGITHSICTLEFENNRALYDWVLNQFKWDIQPYQTEFARLNLTYTVLSKRRLIQLVEEKHVSGWDDPRMPTISGIRRRGFTPESIRDFCERIGVARAENMVDVSLLEHCLREDLNKRARRVMAVLDPIKLTVRNYPENELEEIDFPYHPEDESMGTRKVPFCRELYIEREDFREDPPKKFFRLFPGSEVRLRHAYYVRCVDFIKDAEGKVTEIICEYDPETKGGWSKDGRKVKGTLHWVSAKHCFSAQARLFERLFSAENPMEGDGDFKSFINPNSLKVAKDIKLEPSLASAKAGDFFQFERQGYFRVDEDSLQGNLIFNRSVALRDSWAKQDKA